MTSFVFDTGALTLLYADERRLRPEAEKIQSGAAEALVSSVTLAEFFYKTCQALGKDVATLRSRQLAERMRILPAGTDLSGAAGLEKCRNARLSLADSFVLALAKRVGGVLLTTDSVLSQEKGVRVRYFEV